MQVCTPQQLNCSLQATPQYLILGGNIGKKNVTKKGMDTAEKQADMEKAESMEMKAGLKRAARRRLGLKWLM